MEIDMAYVIAGQSILTAIIRGRHEGQEVMSIFPYRYNSQSPLNDGAAAIEAFHINFAGALGVWQKWRECVSALVVGIRLQYQWTHLDRFAYVEKIPAIGETGTVGGDAYPVNVSVAITKRTQNAGRAQVGTLHMPGVPITFATNGVIQAAATDTYTQLRLKMVEAISTANPAAEFLPVLFHKTAPALSPAFNQTALKPFTRVQRRRTVGVGA